MKRAFLRALLARRAAIKLSWRAALQHAPTHTPLANPDLLAYMIDKTLDELLLTINYPLSSTNGSDSTTMSTLTRTPFGCGLNPYIGYFLAGESALVSVIRTVEPHAHLTENDILGGEIELLFAFRVLSHRDVNAFCEICRIEHPAELQGEPSVLPKNCPFKNGAPHPQKDPLCSR